MQGLGIFLLMSASDKNWYSNFFVANMVSIIHSMQVLNIFNSCTDTMGPFLIPVITCSEDSEGIDWKSNIHTRISSCPSFSPYFLSELPQTKQLELIVKKMCHVTGTSVVLSAPSTFPSVDCGHWPTKLVILYCYIKQAIGTINTLCSIGCLRTSYIC